MTNSQWEEADYSAMSSTKRIFPECSGSIQPEDVKSTSPEKGEHQFALEEEQVFPRGKEEESGKEDTQRKDFKRMHEVGEKLKSKYGWNLENLLDIN